MAPRAGFARLTVGCVCALLALVAADQDETFVTIGSAVKLQHVSTKFRLHSHEVTYGTGSGQQSVTGYPDGDDSNSLWVVRPALGETVPQGTRVAKGSRIRLQHLETRRWLHSHSHLSPLSGRVAQAQPPRRGSSRGRNTARRQQEVSAFGDENQSNTNDNWRVDCESAHWEKDEKTTFTHVDTGVVLYSHAKPFPRPIAGQNEVCGSVRRNKDAEWIAAEGVYYPPIDVGGKGSDKSEL